MTTTVIDLRPSSARRWESYGLAFESTYVYKMRGKGLHNRTHPHRVQVWDNTGRPNTNPDGARFGGQRPGPGTYIDPRGNGTDDRFTVLMSAESIAITNSGTNTGSVASGQVYAPTEPLAVGDCVVLRAPNGLLSGLYTITARPLADPALVPVPDGALVQDGALMRDEAFVPNPALDALFEELDALDALLAADEQRSISGAEHG